MTATTCVKQDSADSALAALATIGLHHGLPVTLPALRELTGFGKQSLESIQLLFAASKCGFTAIPLEGEFDQLPEVALPCIATFRNSQHQVLFDVDASSAIIGDASTGKVTRLTRNDFCQDWTGEVFQVQPNGEIGAARDTLLRLRNPAWVLARALGAVPFAAPRLLFAVLLGAWIAGLFWTPLLAVLTGACLLTSLWMAAYPRGCSRCTATSTLSGSLPVPWVGAGFYALLTAAVLLDARDLVWIGLLAASGAHMALAFILLRNRIACYPCLAIAATAWLALGLEWARLGWTGTRIEILALPAVFIAALLVMSQSSRLASSESQNTVITLAKQVAAELFPGGEGRARLVIYSRKDCPLCIFFRNAVLPGIAEEFGDALKIEERDAASLAVAVPIFFVSGLTHVALLGVPTEEMLPRISESILTALDPSTARAGQLGGFQVVGLENYLDSLSSRARTVSRVP